MRTIEVGDLAIGDGYPPRVMGVLNMSDESNWRPSVHAAVDEAVAYVEDVMVPEGADIVDIGLQSSNPKNDWQPQAVEEQRLEQALAVVERVDADVVFSIETRYAEVADAALAGGFDMVNDVCGFADPEMPTVCRAHDAAVVKMASPPDIRKPGHLPDIDAVFAALERDGFTEKTIIDPALGGWYDGRTPEANREILRRLREFRAFDRPILTATNREDFLGEVAGRLENDEQLPVSLASAALEVDRGAHVIRTHDIAATRDAVLVAHALGEDRHVETGTPRIVELPGTTHREAVRQVSLRDDDPTSADRGAVRSFVIEGLSADEEALLVEAARAVDITVAVDDTVYLSGTVEALGALADALPATNESLSDVSGTVRRAAVSAST